VGRPHQSGVQVKTVDLLYQARSWSRPRRLVAKIEWHRGELSPRIGFVVTNSRLPAGIVIKVYNLRLCPSLGIRIPKRVLGTSLNELDRARYSFRTPNSLLLLFFGPYSDPHIFLFMGYYIDIIH
jgi:hypothetical protein